MNSPQVYIGFCRGTSLVSRLISWFTDGGPSHAFLMYWDDEFDGWLQLGEEFGGWIHLPGEDAGNVCSFYMIPGLDLWKGLRANRKYLGSGYDFGGLLGMSWVMAALHVLRLKAKNFLASRSSFFCSAIIQKILQDSGAKLDLGPSETEPKRLEIETVILGGLSVDFPKLVRSRP